MDSVGWDCRGDFLGQLLKVGIAECAAGIFESTLIVIVLQMNLGYSPWASLCTYPKSRVA